MKLKVGEVEFDTDPVVGEMSLEDRDARSVVLKCLQLELQARRPKTDPSIPAQLQVEIDTLRRRLDEGWNLRPDSDTEVLNLAQHTLVRTLRANDEMQKMLDAQRGSRSELEQTFKDLTVRTENQKAIIRALKRKPKKRA